MKLKRSTIPILAMLIVTGLAVTLKPYLPTSTIQSFTGYTTPVPTVNPTNRIATSKVTRVIDGDTIELETGQVVRFIGIDTPETKHPKKKLQCYGKEANNENRKLVEGKEVRLERDVSEVDRYGRLLRYVFIKTESSPSGLLVNDYLVREGFAFVSTFPPDVKFADHFVNLQRDASAKNKGMWSKCQ